MRVVAHTNIMFSEYDIFAISLTPNKLNAGSLKVFSRLLSYSLIHSLSQRSTTQMYETIMHILLLTKRYVAVCLVLWSNGWEMNFSEQQQGFFFLAALFHILYVMHWINRAFVGDGIV